MSATTQSPPPGRTAPEPSDVALFALAILAIWFLRRALRRRLPRDRD